MGGFSFRRKSTTNEKSYWFCRRTKCHAKGILHSDGEFQPTNFLHNHGPDSEDIERKEKLVKLKKMALQLNVSGRELLRTLGIKRDIKKHLSFIRTCRSRERKQQQERLLLTGSTFPGGSSSKRCQKYTQDGMFQSEVDIWRQSTNIPKHNSSGYRDTEVNDCKLIGNSNETDFNDSSSVHPTAVVSSTLKNNSSIGCSTPEETTKEDCVKSLTHQIRKGIYKEAEQRIPISARNKPNSPFCSSPNFPETFSIETLMAETLEENYGVTSAQFQASLDLSKN